MTADANYVPDLDVSRIPGALIGMTGFAPLQRGQYGSASINDQFAVTGTDCLFAKAFRQVDDSVRLLVFRKENIDEYDSAGTRTNRGTGYSASTTGWNAAAWGNQIIAVNYLDAPQSSTSGAFSELSGSPPKARHIAANLNFVMLADVDDGGSNVYSDMVWWSALQNPESWAASIATQAGNIRLLDAPGPIKALAAYRDLFVAFKENAIFVGEYVGPPFIFQWRLVSSRIGLSATNGVVELDDKLFFVHTSGFYSFDGNGIQNVGLPVFQTFLNTFAYTTISSPSVIAVPSPGADYSGTAFSLVRAVADDVEGVVWWVCYTQKVLDFTYSAYAYGFNPRCQKWAAMGQMVFDSTNPAVWVSTTTADMRAFLGAEVNAQARIWYVDNKASSYLRDLRYPTAWDTDGILGSVATAAFGGYQSTDAVRVYPRVIAGSDGGPFASCTLYGWNNEQRSVGEQTATCYQNAELDCFDGRLRARFKLAYLVGDNAKWCFLAGVGIEPPPQSGR